MNGVDDAVVWSARGSSLYRAGGGFARPPAASAFRVISRPAGRDVLLTCLAGVLDVARGGSVSPLGPEAFRPGGSGHRRASASFCGVFSLGVAAPPSPTFKTGRREGVSWVRIQLHSLCSDVPDAAWVRLGRTPTTCCPRSPDSSFWCRAARQTSRTRSRHARGDGAHSPQRARPVIRRRWRCGTAW